jgi:hypothetical protein
VLNIVKILFFFCMVIVCTGSFASEHSESFKVECFVDELKWKDNNTGFVPMIPDCDLYSETDQVIISQKIVKIVVPTHLIVESANITADYAQISSPKKLSVAPVLWNSEKMSLSDNHLDSRGDYWPPVCGEYLGSSTLHGVTVASFRLFPIQMNKTDNSVSVARNFSITAFYSDNLSQVFPERIVSGDSDNLDKHTFGVLNSSAVNNFKSIPEYSSVSSKHSPTERPSMDGSAVDYTIITSSELAPQFQLLADYKTGRGIRTVVRTIDWIQENYPSSMDQQSQIRDFLKEAYQLWGTRYVLLGGDVSVIPSRMIHNTFYPPGSGTTMPVDLYYVCLDGNWNADGDGSMGEAYISYGDQGDYVDLVAELSIGRAPVVNANQAEIFVDKIISYEQVNVGTHNNNVLFMSEVLFPADYTQGGDIFEDGAVYSEDIISNAMAGSSVEPYRCYEAYDLWSGAHPETHSEVINQMSSGSYGLVVHVGHGFFYNMSVGDRSLDLDDVNTITNTPEYFVLSSLNCASAAIDYNSIMEKFVLNENGGAVVSLGSTRAAFTNTASAYQYNFFSALYQNDIAMIGDAVIESRSHFDHLVNMNTIERWTHMTYALIGDPTLMFHSAAPSELQVVCSDTLSQGNQIVEIQVSDGRVGVENAVVTLSDSNGGYSSSTTDASGFAYLDFIATSAGSVNCVVVAQNYITNISEIVFANSGDPYISIHDYSIIDDGTVGTVGNGDGLPGSGERIGVLFELINSGASWSDITHVELYCSSLECSVITEAVQVEQLNPGEIDSSIMFTVQLSSGIDNASNYDFELIVIEQGTEASDMISVEVVSPVIIPSMMTWNDYPSGNGNGIIEVGEEIELFVNLFNSGWASVSDLTGYVEGVGSGIVPLQAVGYWDEIGKLEEKLQTNRFLIRIDDIGGDVQGMLTIEDSFGHSWTHIFDMVRPSKPVMTSAISPAGGQVLLEWEPVPELDLFGYHLFRSELPNGPFERITPMPIEGSSFYTDSNLAPLTNYYYRVAATDRSRLLSRESFTISVSTSPPEQVGFPITLEVESSSHCAVGDVNGNGEKEIVFAADYIYVWDSDGIELRDGDNDSQTSGPFTDLCGDWGPAGVTLANITDDPGLEILASCRTSRRTFVLKSDGTIADGWPKQMQYWNWATPAVGDIDNNGDMEIVINDIRGNTYVWNHDGTEFYDGDNNPETDGIFHTRENEWYTYSSPALADLNHDNTLEIIFSSKFGNGSMNYLYALGLTGQNISGWPYELSPNGFSHCAPAVGDLDSDGDLEIVIVTENEKLHVVTSTGLPMSPFPIDFIAQSDNAGRVCPSPALADFDDDDNLEIVAVAIHGYDYGQIHVLNLDGENIDGWPVDVAGSTESSPVVADISGDGLLDVVFGVGGGSDSSPNLLYAFKHNGGSVPGFPLTLGGPVRATPMICDLDNDSDVDIVYGGWDLALHVWDLPAYYSQDTCPWPTYHGNIQRTGLYLPASTSDADHMPTSYLKLLPNTPNPFNPKTIIAFEIPIGYRGQVSLNIYDLLGRKVKTLFDSELDGGKYSTPWYGDNDSGKSMASGVYIYKLQTGIDFACRRMTLVR